ncbi:MAG: YceI family protein [Bacteroidota bacterium]
MYRPLIIWILIIIVPAVLLPENPHRILFSKYPNPNNYFQIHVKTNINHFVIKYEQSYELTIEIDLDKSHKPLKYTNIAIPVKHLKLKNKRMQQEFYQMLNTNKYPFINIRIQEKDFINVIRSAYKKLPASITIAGVTNKIRLSLDTKHVDKNQYFVKGSKSLSLYNYQLSPPKKLGGIIKVDSNVLINFGMSVFLNT